MKNSFCTCLVLLTVAVLAFGQGSKREDAALAGSTPIAYPQVRVCSEAATGTPCAPLATIYTDKTLTTAKPNPFTGDAFGNFEFYGAPGWYMVQVSAPGVQTYTYKVLLPPDVANATFQTLNVSGVLTISGSFTAASFSTNAVNPATSGTVKLAKGDQICWRNEANSANVCISKNSSDQIIGAVASTPLISSTINPAVSGQVRLAKSDTICWRNEANTGDVCLSKNTSDQLIGASATAPFITNSANPASSGTFRLGNADQICWRNAANTSDVCLSKNNLDQIVGANATAPLLSPKPNIADTGTVRMAQDDQICWRDEGNLGNVCLSKNDNNSIQLPNNGFTFGVGGSPVSRPPIGLWNPFTTGDLGGTSTLAKWKPHVNVATERFQVWLATPGAGCSTLPVLKLRNET